VSPAWERIREAVTRNKTERLTALAHHITVDASRLAFLGLKRDAAPGVDGMTGEQYDVDLERNLIDLHRRVHAGTYRAQPSRRKYIPKPDGRQRPLGIASLEDKIVQGAVVAILTPVHEAEFLGFSHGFRPGRSQHQALDALHVGMTRRKVNWVLDADITKFFDMISHDWMIMFLEHRIGDRRIIRLIQKWLRAGVLEEGQKIESIEGTPQGAVISPLLANIYLHYVFDLWAEQWRRRHATGDMIIVRYADDGITGFQYRRDADRFLNDLWNRLATFSLSLHPDKTRLIEFGRFAAESRRKRDEGKPETFDFLGFTHFCDRTRKNGSFVIGRQTKRSGMLARLRQIKDGLRARMNKSINDNGRWPGAVPRGHYAYFAVPRNSRALQLFYDEVRRLWFRRPRRRGQRRRMSWEKMKPCVRRYLPRPRIVHPWPSRRFDVRGLSSPT
jgi:RNA-directed DNA polymerase